MLISESSLVDLLNTSENAEMKVIHIDSIRYEGLQLRGETATIVKKKTGEMFLVGYDYVGFKNGKPKIQFGNRHATRQGAFVQLAKVML